MWDDVKGMLPPDFMNKRLSKFQRMRSFVGNINGQYRNFKVITKLAKNFTPREYNTLSQKISRIVREEQDKSRNEPLSMGVLYHAVIDQIYRKQLPGMGK